VPECLSENSGPRFGHPAGDEAFVARIEELTGRSLRAKEDEPPGKTGRKAKA
jgi:hypothetical protein